MNGSLSWFPPTKKCCDGGIRQTFKPISVLVVVCICVY